MIAGWSLIAALIFMVAVILAGLIRSYRLQAGALILLFVGLFAVIAALHGGGGR
jgi:hypothetical protein